MGSQNVRTVLVHRHPRPRLQARHLHVRQLLQRGGDAGRRDAPAQADVHQLRQLRLPGLQLHREEHVSEGKYLSPLERFWSNILFFCSIHDL